MFTLYKMFKTNTVKAVSFKFAINDELKNKYILREDEENEITELLRKFNMYDKIRFIDGISYNISVESNFEINQPIPQTSEDWKELGELEITDDLIIAGDKVYSRDVPSFGVSANIGPLTSVKFVSKDIISKII